MVAYTQWGSDGPVSRRLLLLRHAAAEFSGGQDHNRPLSTTGRAQARAQGVHMLAASLVPQSVICSSALRTRTTLDLLLDQWGKHAAKIDIEITDDIYQASATQVLTRAQSLPNSIHRALVLGHEPTMSMLASALAGPDSDPGAVHLARVGFMTGGLGILDFAADWQDLAPGAAQLRALVPPSST